MSDDTWDCKKKECPEFRKDCIHKLRFAIDEKNIDLLINEMNKAIHRRNIAFKGGKRGTLDCINFNIALISHHINDNRKELLA